MSPLVYKGGRPVVPPAGGGVRLKFAWFFRHRTAPSSVPGSGFVHSDSFPNTIIAERILKGDAAH